MIICHLPMLSIVEGATAPALGGEIRRLDFDEFETIDRDWARKSLFHEGAAVWVSEAADESDGSDGDSDDRAELVRLAASATLVAPLPSPQLSMTYRYNPEFKSVRRRAGPFERTLLVKDVSLAEAGTEELLEIADLADRWYAAGFRPDHPVFAALDAFGCAFASSTERAEMRMFPTLVALEGLFAAEPGPGIARRMYSALHALFEADVLTEKTIKKLYSVRSDIIHGRAVGDEAVEVVNGVAAIACGATIALLERLIEENVAPDRWTSVLEPDE